jgi:hypothetical protein
LADFLVSVFSFMSSYFVCHEFCREESTMQKGTCEAGGRTR